MNVYIDKTETESKAITRVIEALVRYAPKNIKFVEGVSASDIVIISVVGRLNHIKARIAKYQKPYAIVQYILRGSLNPNTADWASIWEKASVVWSYYDLAYAVKEDGGISKANFYHSPLGVDQGVFRPLKKEKKYIICTSGLLYMTESVRECIKAAEGRKVMHLGPELNIQNVDCYSGIDDETLANLYNQCEFVSGLRRTQGFELSAAEGLICGVRPILFDKPHYQKWYEGLAEFIPENSRVEVIENLKAIFNGERKPVTENEMAEAARRFNWEKIISGFWERAI